MGVSSDRVLDRPKVWDGRANRFDDFSFEFSNGLGGLPGGGDSLLEHAERHGSGISATTMTPEQIVMACGTAMSLKSMVGGKALDIIKAGENHNNGFEMWRRLHVEHKPHTSSHTASLLEVVMIDKPDSSEDFSM